MRSRMGKGPAGRQLTLYVFVGVLFVVGVIFGGLMVNALTFEQQQDLASDMSQYVQLMHGGAVADSAATFWERVFFHGKWLLVLWFLGITVVGIPLVLAMDFLKGVLVGFALGTLITQYSWKGVLFSLVSIAPPNLIIVPAILMASASALSFSLYVVKNRLMRQNGTLAPQMLSFTTTAMLMLMVLIGAALLEAYVSPLLMSWAAPILDASAAAI
ncbi:stage II sporulation protein M [Paenibacillus sp. Leaf72]|uniref:stage II sporulation protein M n=1 Tax=Paenibacillus sp. Leaf72 TaxID=1736234 RepID=UPI0006F72CEE|nr:stage II sporulation protein M [Paenibacillus sp. Leaf72]KQO17468.1 stage II sporulation protein M [Paenibacillus sp. Leaf72]